MAEMARKLEPSFAYQLMSPGTGNKLGREDEVLSDFAAYFQCHWLFIY